MFNSISISTIKQYNSWFKPRVGTTRPQPKDRHFPNQKTSDITNTTPPQAKTSFQKSSSGMVSTSDKELLKKQNNAGDNITKMNANIEVPKSTGPR